MIKSLAEERVTTAIDVAALQQRAAALQAQLVEERELTRELLVALRQQSEREQLPMPHAAAVEAAAEAALRRAFGSGPMWQGARQQRPRSRSSNAPCARSVRSIHVPRVWYVGWTELN